MTILCTETQIIITEQIGPVFNIVLMLRMLANSKADEGSQCWEVLTTQSSAVRKELPFYFLKLTNK